MFLITDIENAIESIKNPSDQDIKVLCTVDSFWGCPEYWVKAYLAGKIAKYVGYEAWEIAMDYVYGNR